MRRSHVLCEAADVDDITPELCLAPCLAPKFGNSVQLGAMNVQLFALFSAVSVLGMRRNRTFNAVVAGSSPARLTMILNVIT